MEGAKKRYRELDLYKGIGIILTVTASTGMLSDALKNRFFDCVCFPLFMLAAGALWHRKGYEADEKSSFAETVRTVFMPYFWFSLICLLTDALGMFISPQLFTLERIYGHIWDTVSFTGISVLWFLPAYFLAVWGYRMFRHSFSLPVMGAVLLIVAAALTSILYYKGYMGMTLYEETEISASSYGMRIALLFWRGSMGMFFCMCGEFISWISERIAGRKIITGITGLVLTGAGFALSFFAEGCDYRYMVLGKPYITLPMSLCYAAGIYFLCVWIGTFRPFDFLGRNAVIIYLTFSSFGIMQLALKAGEFVFAKLDNNFANRATVALIILVLELPVIYVMNLKPFSFLFGHRDLSAPEKEEDIL